MTTVPTSQTLPPVAFLAHTIQVLGPAQATQPPLTQIPFVTTSQAQTFPTPPVTKSQHPVPLGPTPIHRVQPRFRQQQQPGYLPQSDQLSHSSNFDGTPFSHYTIPQLPAPYMTRPNALPIILGPPSDLINQFLHAI